MNLVYHRQDSNVVTVPCVDVIQLENRQENRCRPISMPPRHWHRLTRLWAALGTTEKVEMLWVNPIQYANY